MNFAYFARGREQTQFTQGRWTTLDNPHSIFQWREPIEGKLAGMTLMTLTPCIQRICQAIDHWRRHHRGHLWSQLNRHANVFDDNSEESAWIAWDAVDATAGVLQNLLEGHCGLKSHQVSPSLCSACPATSTQTIHMFHIVPQPICPKSKICPLSLCVLAIGSVQSPFEVRILFPLWPSPGFTWGKGERASVQWDQIEYILLCKIPSHIQSTQSMRKRNVVGWYNSEHWQWYGYGSIPIHTIFRGWTSIYQLILMFTRGIGFWPIPIFWSESDKVRKMAVTCPAAKLWSSQIDSPNQCSPPANHPRQAPACEFCWCG